MTETKMPKSALEDLEDPPFMMSTDQAALDDSDQEFAVEIASDETGREFDVALPDDESDAPVFAAEESRNDVAADAAGETVDVSEDEDSAMGFSAEDSTDSDMDASDEVVLDEDTAESEQPVRAPLAFTPDMDAEREQLRMVEALLFAAAEPLDEATLAGRLPAAADIPALLATLQAQMQGRGVELVRVASGWRLQTPADLAWLLEDVREERRKLSAAARETLAIIAYHQPVTRAEIEDIRGVAVSKGTVDMLMELGWVRMRGRRRAPGRPVTYGTTEAFLSHFGLESLTDLPGKAELKAAGLLDNRLPADFAVPEPGLFDASDEDPLEDTPLENAAFHVDFIEESGEEADQVQTHADNAA